MVMLPFSSAREPVLSVTLTVNVNVPLIVGFPVSDAGGVAARLSPGGSCPAAMDRCTAARAAGEEVLQIGCTGCAVWTARSWECDQERVRWVDREGKGLSCRVPRAVSNLKGEPACLDRGRRPVDVGRYTP